MLHGKIRETPGHQETPLKHMTTRTSLRPAAERVSPLREAVTTALDDMKAVNVRVLDVRGLTDIADTMFIASGNSDRHVRSIAELVDLQDLIVHVMLPRVREFYGLERLWEGGGETQTIPAAALKITASRRRQAST